ncbi:MAG TPA: hypothetical protein VNX65_02880 [Patescibacteria group bacterium]|nr:hypothetical protein [Patescibacteria group bacterium]
MVICTLGRQPELGMAELESLYGASALHSLNNQVASVDVEARDINQNNLGGTIKIATPLITLNTTKWDAIIDACQQQLIKLAPNIPEGKITIGLSALGVRVNSRDMQRAGLSLKKSLKNLGHSVRLVPNAAPELNSAQVLHNQLTGPRGVELLLISGGQQTHIARTTSVQDIDDYTRRDFGRPKRDALVGMLPPKLAQIMINLAQAKPDNVLLDPFCGTGVVLTEAALLGLRLQGSDLDSRMIDYTIANLDWLSQTYGIVPSIIDLSVADAQQHNWHKPIDTVVCETYLGKPLVTLPDVKQLQKIVNDCDNLVRKFLINLQAQLDSGTRCCIAVPAWQTPKGFITLPVIDDLKKIGYNQVSFSNGTGNLRYYRKDQIVARQLLVLTRQ